LEKTGARFQAAVLEKHDQFRYNAALTLAGAQAHSAGGKEFQY
jgi:hypothetical protein